LVKIGHEIHPVEEKFWQQTVIFTVFQPLTHKSAEIKVQFETNAASFDQCILRGKNAL